MRVLIPVLLAGLTATPALSSDSPRDTKRLTQATAGRSSGEPVDCIDRRRSGDFSVAGRNLIFRPSSRLTYVATVSPGCGNGMARQALVLRSTSSRICRGDIAEAVDPLGGAAGGSCTLGSFTPWTR